MFVCSQRSPIRKIDRQASEALMLSFGSRAELGVWRISVVDGAPLSFLHYRSRLQQKKASTATDT